MLELGVFFLNTVYLRCSLVVASVSTARHCVAVTSVSTLRSYGWCKYSVTLCIDAVC